MRTDRNRLPSRRVPSLLQGDAWHVSRSVGALWCAATGSSDSQRLQQQDHAIASTPQTRAQPLIVRCISDETVAVPIMPPESASGPFFKASVLKGPFAEESELHCAICASPFAPSRSVSSVLGRLHPIATCRLCLPRAASATSCAGHHHVEPSTGPAEPWMVHGWFARPVGVGMGLVAGSLQPACQDLCCACCQVPLVLQASCFAPFLPPLCQQCYRARF